MVLRAVGALAALASLSVLSFACSENAETGDPNAVTETHCVATFRVLQKDAYKSTAGRSSELWPPHTTTVLELSCDGEAVGGSFQANHGTEPAQVDENGDVILVEQAVFEVEGPRAELEDLKAAYDACGCDAETEFLSLDSLDDTTAQALVQTVDGYLNANLTCPSGSPSDIVGKLQQGDVPGAIDQLVTCEWTSGASFEEGLDLALEQLAADTGKLLSGYHVCNNDAALQKALFDDYVATGEVTACDATAAVCHGPTWLYTP
jgi:hypothetical protein